MLNNQLRAFQIFLYYFGRLYVLYYASSTIFQWGWGPSVMIRVALCMFSISCFLPYPQGRYLTVEEATAIDTQNKKDRAYMRRVIEEDRLKWVAEQATLKVSKGKQSHA